MRRSTVAAMVATAVILASCEESNTYVEPPPPQVTVAKPLLRDVTDYVEFTGTTAAVDLVEVRARVPGVLKAKHFEPGTTIEAGDLLFEIDPAEYQANLEAAQANLASAEAAQINAAKALERAQTLITRGNISQARLDEAEAEARTAEAAVLLRRAELRRAEIDLSYTQVHAPISGRVGRNRIDVGNLVGEDGPTVLTEVTTFDPIHVFFSMNERDLLRAIERVREDPSTGTAQGSIPLELGLADEIGYPHHGVTDFIESRLDPTTGTLEMRGVFVNDQQPPALLPGLFARVRSPIGTRRQMPHVTERAIGFDQSGSFVLVVTEDQTVEQRIVALGQTIDGLRVVEDGLGPDDFVIVNGIQRARAGAKVETEVVDMETLTASALQTAATQ